MKKIFLLLLVLPLFTYCDNKNTPEPDEQNKPINLTAAQKTRVSQDNDFAFNFLEKTITTVDNQNVFLSPMSVSIALGMLRNGAIGTTKAEIEKTIQLSGLTDDEINSYYKVMQTTLPKLDAKTDLNIANSIWYRQGFDVKANFLKVNADYFDAYVKALDFTNQLASLNTINGWCAEKTNNLIPKVLDNIDGNAMMFLMNAVYFKGIWMKQFNEKSTIDYPFTNEKNQQKTVRMMAKEDTVNYTTNNTAQIVDLPYGNGSFSMTVILPFENKTTTEVIKSMNGASLNTAIQSMKPTKVKLFLPRFKTKNTYMLNDALKAMGMRKAFDEDAELDGLSAMKPLFVSFVQHDTYVENTEVGTKAAAVTTIGVYTTSMPVDQIPTFIANKPFVFLIREKSTGIILFIGKMGDIDKF